MDGENGDTKSCTGYDGDTGSGSDEDEDCASNVPVEIHNKSPNASNLFSADDAKPTTTLPVDAMDPVPAATTNTLVMGYHTIYDLDNTDLPLYVREHGATLTFPEKVSQ
jgi:hypothetical protein